MATNQLEQLDHDPLTHLDDEDSTPLLRHQELAGCFNIIGPISICWKLIGGDLEVCLVIAGIRIVCSRINPRNPCTTLEGNVLLAKASIKLCLEGRCLTFDAQACLRDLTGPWKCVRERGTIVCL